MRMGEVLYEFDAFEAGELLRTSRIPPELEQAYSEGRWTFSSGAVKVESVVGTMYAEPGDYVAILGGRLSVLKKDDVSMYRKVERVCV